MGTDIDKIFVGGTVLPFHFSPTGGDMLFYENLAPYIGGQLEIRSTQPSIVYQGGIQQINTHQGIIRVFFSWLSVTYRAYTEWLRLEDEFAKPFVFDSNTVRAITITKNEILIDPVDSEVVIAFYQHNHPRTIPGPLTA